MYIINVHRTKSTNCDDKLFPTTHPNAYFLRILRLGMMRKLRIFIERFIRFDGFMCACAHKWFDLEYTGIFMGNINFRCISGARTLWVHGLTLHIVCEGSVAVFKKMLLPPICDTDTFKKIILRYSTILHLKLKEKWRIYFGPNRFIYLKLKYFYEVIWN